MPAVKKIERDEIKRNICEYIGICNKLMTKDVICGGKVYRKEFIKNGYHIKSKQCEKCGWGESSSFLINS